MQEQQTSLQLHVGPYRTTYVGMEVIRKSTKNEWQIYGEILKRVDEAKQWAIGDWLVDGKSHYGDGLYKEATKVLGTEGESGETYLRRFKMLSERFELLKRFNNLSWGHHFEVASLKTLITDKKGKLSRSNIHDMEKAQELLAIAEKEKWSVRDLRNAVAEHVRRQDEAIRLANEPERYNIILADPAWEYEFSRSDSRQIDNQYTPTTLDEMKRLQIPAASDSVLFMWATSPKQPEALELIQAWGFEYKTCMIWVKDKIGMGYYARQKHELLLIAARGSLQLPNEDQRPESVFEAPRNEHSEKPEIVYEIIEKMYPVYKKLEMFARKKRTGWSVWGDEVEDE